MGQTPKQCWLSTVLYVQYLKLPFKNINSTPQNSCKTITKRLATDSQIKT